MADETGRTKKFSGGADESVAITEAILRGVGEDGRDHPSPDDHKGKSAKPSVKTEDNQ